MLFDKNLKYASNGSYGGIGSRKLTVHNSLLMAEFAFYMTLSGYRLNSGGADGSDTSCEWGAKLAYDFLSELGWVPPGEYERVMSIYLPWAGFNGRPNTPAYISKSLPLAETITKEHHPAWNNLSRAARLMMSRNCHQALGLDLQTFADFMFCWTPDGASTIASTSSRTGGTGQAIRISETYGIKTLNFGLPEHKKILMSKLDSARLKAIEHFGIDGREHIKKMYLAHNPFKQSTFESFKDLVHQHTGNQIIIHGANCQNTMASGFAKEIKETFMPAYEADCRTAKGSRKKLGTYSFANIALPNSNLSVVNAYTQDRWGRKPVLYMDYNKTRDAMNKINNDFPDGKIIVPKIGAGLANGCWITVSNILDTAFKGREVCLLKSRSEELSLDNILKTQVNYENNIKNKSNQMSLL